MSSAGPMMEKVLEENTANFYLQNSKGQAAKSNAVELKVTL